MGMYIIGLNTEILNTLIEHPVDLKVRIKFIKD